MPITVDLERSPFLRQLFEAACTRVRIENIIIVLQARFGESVPSDMEERLQKLSQEELDGMVGRIAILTSKLLNMPSTRPKPMPFGKVFFLEVASPWSGVLDLRDAEVIKIVESYRKKK
jgi:hypothetical protein